MFPSISLASFDFKGKDALWGKPDQENRGSV